MSQTKTRLLTRATLAFLTLFGAVAAQASDKWIHVRINGGGDDRVSINLPMSLLEAAAAMIPDEVRQDAELQIDELDMDWYELRNFWESVKDAPEATFVTVQTKDETIAVKKEGNFVLIKTTEASRKGSRIDVRFPMNVIDALLSGREGTLDFQAALRALADYGPGQLVSIRDDDETIEIWIDSNQEAD